MPILSVKLIIDTLQGGGLVFAHLPQQPQKKATTLCKQL